MEEHQLGFHPNIDLSTEGFPSQDLIDRSEDFAIIGILLGPWGETTDTETILVAKREEWSLASAFRQELERAVADSVRDVLQAAPLTPAPAKHYQIGPAAEGPPTYIIEIWNAAKDLAPILSGVADVYAVYEITRRVKDRLDEWVHRVGASYCKPVLIHTPYQLAKICEQHVRRTYHPRATLEVDWFPITTEFWGGYLSPAHPTRDMQYFVTVRAGRRTYSYVVDGDARVRAHHLREGRRTIPLQVPALFAYETD